MGILGHPGDDDGLLLHPLGHHQIEGDVAEGALEADPGGDVEVEDELLQRLFDGGVAQPVSPDEGGTVGIEGGPGLRTGALTLGGEGGVDNLAEEGAQVLGRLRGDLALHPAEAHGQQLLEVPPTAVGAVEAEVMDMDRPLLMGGGDGGRIDLAEPVAAGEGLADVVVHPVDGLLGIGVLLDHPGAVVQVIVEERDGGIDEGLPLTHLAPLLAVEDVRLGCFTIAGVHQVLLDEILDLLHRDGGPSPLTGLIEDGGGDDIDLDRF